MDNQNYTRPPVNNRKPAQTGRRKRKLKPGFIAALVVIALIIVAAVSVSVFSKPGYRSTVNKYFSAVESESGEDFADVTIPEGDLREAYIKAVNKGDNSGFNKEMQESVTAYHNVVQSMYGGSFKFSNVKISEMNKFDDAALQAKKKEFSDKYGADVNITEGYNISGVFGIKSDEGRDQGKFEGFILNVDGSWIVSVYMI